VHAANEAPSLLHWKVEPASEENEKLAEVLLTYPEGPEAMVVSGGEATVQVRLAGLASVLPAVSVAFTWKVCEPSANPE
jgi:hypothetical protein